MTKQRLRSRQRHLMVNDERARVGMTEPVLRGLMQRRSARWVSSFEPVGAAETKISFTSTNLATADELAHTRSLLQDAQRQTERADAEVQVTRRLIDEMKKAPAGTRCAKQKTG